MTNSNAKSITILALANSAKAAIAVVDNYSRECRVLGEALAVTGDADTYCCDMIKSVVASYPEANYTLIMNKNLALPIAEAMSVWKLAVREEVNFNDANEVAKMQKFLTRIAATDVDISNIDQDSVADMVAVAFAAITNDRTDRGALNFLLTLALTGGHKFRSIDQLLEEDKEGAKHSQVELDYRNIAAQLNKMCELPAMTFTTVGINEL
jgi:hypothetical protein